MTQIRPLVVLAAVVALVAASCSSSEGPSGNLEMERTPQPAVEPVTEADTSHLWLPTIFEDTRILDPAWSTPVQYLDGVYLGAAERDGVLDFTAIDEYGDPLWTVQRPASCSGFTLTMDSDGRSLAVLTDTQTTDASLAAITASAYDLRTGEQVWGPAEVPGSYQGPGLVFAAVTDGFMGEGIRRTVLNPDTGEVFTAESEADSTRVIGEHDGLILTVDRTFLTAHDAAADEVWRIPLEQHGWHASALKGSFERFKAPGYTIIDTTGGSGALINLETGEVIAEEIRDAAIDDMTGVMLILNGTDLAAFDLEGNEIWAASVSDETHIAVAGGVYVYLREADAVRAHNTLTGQIAEAYDPAGAGTIVVPEHMTASGSGLLYDGERRLIATRPPDVS